MNKSKISLSVFLFLPSRSLRHCIGLNISKPKAKKKKKNLQGQLSMRLKTFVLKRKVI